jgi:hypothetical protein
MALDWRGGFFHENFANERTKEDITFKKKILFRSKII